MFPRLVRWSRYQEMDYGTLLQREVIDPGNCTHCGVCAGLCPETLEMRDGRKGPLPDFKPNAEHEDEALQAAWTVCPGRGVPFPELFESIHGHAPESWLLGPCAGIWTGHSADPSVRRRGASGGVISQVLIHLLETRRIDGAVVLQQGLFQPDRAAPTVAVTREQVLAAAQSVYCVTPVLDVLPQMAEFEGNLAFVGLPDQVAALRMLQVLGHPGAGRVRYILGPYTGTNMYPGAVRAFLRGNGVSDSVPIESLQWRAGEWPGHLRVETEDGRVFTAKKFYYNYLIPFFISRNCLITPDFTNELTDISVGDAWSPQFEAMGGGHSVVVARNQEARELLEDMRDNGALRIEPIEMGSALNMHGHMLDLKKRGCFLRLDQQESRGLPIPVFGYRPQRIEFKRRLVERVIGVFLALGRSHLVRELATRLPSWFVGGIFNTIRKTWKFLSKPTKRKGLIELEFHISGCPDRWKEITELSQRGYDER